MTPNRCDAGICDDVKPCSCVCHLCDECGRPLDECDADDRLMCDADGTALQRARG